VRHRTAGLTGPPVRAPGRPDSGGRRRTRTTYARRYPIARSVRSVARCCGAVACGGRRGQAEDRRRRTARPVDSGSGRANGEREPPRVGSPYARALSTRGWLIGRGAASSWRGSGLGGVGALGATPSIKKKKTQFYLLTCTRGRPLAHSPAGKWPVVSPAAREVRRSAFRSVQFVTTRGSCPMPPLGNLFFFLGSEAPIGSWTGSGGDCGGCHTTQRSPARRPFSLSVLSRQNLRSTAVRGTHAKPTYVACVPALH